MNRLTLAIFVALLSGSALADTALGLRRTMMDQCFQRGVSRGDDSTKTLSACTCAIDVVEKNLTLAEIAEIDRFAQERRDARSLPQSIRIGAQLRACSQE
jgi:hypothetical protein